MRKFVPTLILVAAVVAIVWAASNNKPLEQPRRYGDVAKAECVRGAGPERDSQEACLSGKLLRKAIEMQAADR
jgi:hypothetical protein